ncbi:MAG: DUF2442 domain-containing protein [Leptospiraceae bacterium]|nr:DUF2442 domain-containing protein [Leptospiraceae bacterium]
MNSPVEQEVYLREAKPLPDFRLKVVTTAGEEMVLDLAPLIYSRDFCWRLRQERYFRMVRVDEHGVLSWPEGEDLAPESILRFRVLTP